MRRPQSETVPMKPPTRLPTPTAEKAQALLRVLPGRKGRTLNNAFGRREPVFLL